ncbi:hypothetical protein Tco_1170884, partial [Tanacetum coccineum]
MESHPGIYLTWSCLEFGRYAVLVDVNTAYWKFLGVGTTLNIFQNILLLYLGYGVLRSSGYGVSHPTKAETRGKENIVADALSRKEWMKLRRARAMSTKIHSSIKAKILEAQSEDSK